MNTFIKGARSLRHWQTERKHFVALVWVASLKRYAGARAIVCSPKVRLLFCVAFVSFQWVFLK